MVITGLGLLSFGYCDAVIAGGTDIMSDVPIRHSRRMRRLMLALGRAKTLPQRAPIIAQMLNPKNWQPEVCDPTICFGILSLNRLQIVCAPNCICTASWLSSVNRSSHVFSVCRVFYGLVAGHHWIHVQWDDGSLHRPPVCVICHFSLWTGNGYILNNLSRLHVCPHVIQLTIYLFIYLICMSFIVTHKTNSVVNLYHTVSVNWKQSILWQESVISDWLQHIKFIDGKRIFSR